ncbi:MAG: SpoIIE family protein phosphatase [Magnetococcales bacterium]|nr:SpoIIE family protein phosphatase [Magnetococcales bacterium]
MKLRGQLALTLVPMVVLPLFVLGWMASEYLVESRRQSTRDEMDTLLQQIETNANTHLTAVRANLSLFSHANLVTNYLGVEEAETRYTVFQAPLLQLFADYASAYPEYYEFRILMPDGYEDARYTQGEIPNKAEEEGETPYFKRLKEEKADYYTEFMINPDNGQPALLATKRLSVQTASRVGLGKEPLQAYIALTIQPDFLARQVHYLHVGRRGFAFFADPTGRILIGPKWRQLPERLDDEDWGFLTTLAAEKRFDHFGWMDKNFLVKGIPLGKSLYLFTAMDEADLSEGIDSLHVQVVGITVAAILLLFPLLYGVLQHRFVRPLLHLSEASQQVGQGDFAIKFTQTDQNNELGSLMQAFYTMVRDLDRLHAALREHALRLEEKVAERTAELNVKNSALEQSLVEIAYANKKIQDSIQYAQRIQQALLPDWSPVRERLADSFVLWEPRDVVGGDIYFADVQGDSVLLALLDCTGHGVPGAFMTMIAVAGLKRIVRDEGVRNPDEVLRLLNFSVKTTLQQDGEQARSNDGLDAAIVVIDRQSRHILFAGAKLSLIIIQQGRLQVIKGDNRSIGYKDSCLDDRYTTHRLVSESGMVCYLATDGVVDQLGGPKGFAFGNKRFQAQLLAQASDAMEQQKSALQTVLRDYQGEMERMDDLTVLGFRV